MADIAPPFTTQTVFTELSPAMRIAIRDKARENKAQSCIHLSDEWVANAVRMLMRDDLAHEPVCQAARDRIMALSLKVEELQREIQALKGEAR